jgi:hypothetical protein
MPAVAPLERASAFVGSRPLSKKAFALPAAGG